MELVTEVRVAYSWTRAASASNRLRNLSFASALDAPSRAAKRSNFAAIGQSRLQRVIEASDQPLEIERAGDPAFNANVFAFVGQLPFVAGCASQAGVVAGRPALDWRRNRCLADADRQTIRVIPDLRPEG